MALTDAERRTIIESWFDQPTRAFEQIWVGKLIDVAPIYQEMGFTLGEAAILFMLSQVLIQVSSITTLIKRRDEDDEGDAPK